MDTYDFLADPRTLTIDERTALRDQHAGDQELWLARLVKLCDGHRPADDFPAFLLATAPFADLAARIGEATQRQSLPTDVKDELDWFCDAFEGYLRTLDGEDAFVESPRLTG